MKVREAWIFYYPDTADVLYDEDVLIELQDMRVALDFPKYWVWNERDSKDYPNIAKLVSNFHPPINVEILIDLC